jgi:WD40 repeat protein
MSGNRMGNIACGVIMLGFCCIGTLISAAPPDDVVYRLAQKNKPTLKTEAPKIVVKAEQTQIPAEPILLKANQSPISAKQLTKPEELGEWYLPNQKRAFDDGSPSFMSAEFDPTLRNLIWCGGNGLIVGLSDNSLTAIRRRGSETKIVDGLNYDDSLGAIEQPRFTNDGRTMLLTTALYDFDKKVLRLIPEEHQTGVIAISPDGSMFALGNSPKDDSPGLLLLNSDDFSVKARLQGFRLACKSVMFSPDGTVLVARLHDAQQNQKIAFFDPIKSSDEFQEIHFPPANTDKSSRKQVLFYRGDINSLFGGSFATLVNGAPVATEINKRIQNEKDVRVWIAKNYLQCPIFYRYDLGPNKRMALIDVSTLIKKEGPNLATQNNAESTALTVALNGAFCVTGDKTGFITIWDAKTQKTYQQFQAHAGPVRALGLSPDGRFLASAGREARFKLWRLAPDEGN